MTDQRGHGKAQPQRLRRHYGQYIRNCFAELTEKTSRQRTAARYTNSGFLLYRALPNSQESANGLNGWVSTPGNMSYYPGSFLAAALIVGAWCYVNSAQRCAQYLAGHGTYTKQNRYFISS